MYVTISSRFAASLIKSNGGSDASFLIHSNSAQSIPIDGGMIMGFADFDGLIECV